MFRQSHFNFSLHFSIIECYLPHKIVFYDCLDQQRIWVVPALSLLDPQAEQLQNLISLFVMNSLISFVCNSGRLTPHFKGKWGLISLNSEYGAAWSLSGSERLKLFESHPQAFTRVKPHNQDEIWPSCQSKLLPANLTHRNWLAEGTSLRAVRRALQKRSALFSLLIF